jgi:hypothetical protein
MNFNEWLTANGHDPESVSEKAKLHLQAIWRSEQAGDQKPVNPVAAANAGTPVGAVAQTANAVSDGGGFDATMKAIEAENDRIEFIRSTTVRACQEAIGDTDRVRNLRALSEAAVADKTVNKQRWELEMVRNRAYSPNIFAPSNNQVTGDVLEAALCQAAGLKNLDKHFNEKTLDAAHKQYKGGMGLQELIGTVAKKYGFHGSAARDLRGAMKAIQYGEMQATGGFAASTYDVSGILTNSLNKFVRSAFNYVERVWPEISATRSVRDFKQISSYSLTGNFTYEKLAPGGEIRHATLGNETYTNQADTYAKMLGIDRRDLINDDLGAFAEVGRKLGRGGAQAINDVFWAEFMDNATFFTSGRGNFDDGTDTAFSSSGLEAANVIWRAMTDPDGRPMGSRGAILLVPPKFEVAAMQLMNSLTINAADSEGTSNPWAGRFRVVVSDYLSNSSFTGYSTDAWYILADPQDVPVMEVVFLNGQEMPTIESVDMDFNRLGIGIRGYHDFGAALQEYRGGLKLKGTV